MGGGVMLLPTQLRRAQMPIVTIRVDGTPAAQGSKRHIGGGRLVEQSKAVKPWRKNVRAAAEAAVVFGMLTDPLSGPLQVDITFTVRKPVSAPKRRRTWPAVRPDLDKMLRSTFDALTEARVWSDDGQVVEVTGRKVYPDEHESALSAPGAVIRVWQISDEASAVAA
jgi:Holliday junction resolvase RusA-like endonuclease